jgi:hypothetical protein
MAAAATAKAVPSATAKGGAPAPAPPPAPVPALQMREFVMPVHLPITVDQCQNGSATWDVGKLASNHLKFPGQTTVHSVTVKLHGATGAAPFTFSRLDDSDPDKEPTHVPMKPTDDHGPAILVKAPRAATYDGPAGTILPSVHAHGVATPDGTTVRYQELERAKMLAAMSAKTKLVNNWNDDGVFDGMRVERLPNGEKPAVPTAAFPAASHVGKYLQAQNHVEQAGHVFIPESELQKHVNAFRGVSAMTGRFSGHGLTMTLDTSGVRLSKGRPGHVEVQLHLREHCADDSTPTAPATASSGGLLLGARQSYATKLAKPSAP